LKWEKWQEREGKRSKKWKDEGKEYLNTRKEGKKYQKEERKYCGKKERGVGEGKEQQIM